MVSVLRFVDDFLLPSFEFSEFESVAESGLFGLSGVLPSLEWTSVSSSGRDSFKPASSPSISISFSGSSSSD